MIPTPPSQRAPSHHSTRGRLTSIVSIAALAVVSLLVFGNSAQAQSNEGATSEPLKVVIKSLEPFVMKAGDGYRGFSIDLWQEIARRIGSQYEYEYVETVTDQLAAVESGKSDLGITGISITREREEAVDFSLPYFNAGLQVMTPANTGGGWSNSLQSLQSTLFAGDLVYWLSVLVLAIVVMAHIFWLLERNRNPDFPAGYLKGVWEAIWYTVVTLVTVGYGDRTTKSVLGRLFAMAWMFTSLLIVANFTANLTSQLTVSRFEGIVRGPEDLPGKRIATVEGSTAAKYLEAQGIPYTGVAAIDFAYLLLQQGNVDAVVYDSPVLLYHAATEGEGMVNVVGPIFEPQDYGVAFPSGSELREDVNRALLDIQEDGTYTRIYDDWFSQ